MIHDLKYHRNYQNKNKLHVSKKIEKDSITIYPPPSFLQKTKNPQRLERRGFRYSSTTSGNARAPRREPAYGTYPIQFL